MHAIIRNKSTCGAEFSWTLLAVGIAVLLSANCITGKVDYTGCDAHGNLLTSQVLVETGHLWLESYLAKSDSLSYGISERNQHLIYFFPMGTPILSIPVVAFVTSFGADLRVRAQDRVLQRILAALTVGLAFLLLYAFCLRFLPSLESLILSATFIGGSSFISTAGTALWSLDFGFVLIILAMLLLLRDGSDGKPLRGSAVVAAGISLCFAFMCRPTFAIPAVLLTLDTLLRNRRAGLILVATSIACAVPAAMFSLREYGTLLPAYYLPSRIDGHASFLVSLTGHLVSPGRGVFAFNPFLIVVFVVLVATFLRWRTQRMAWLALVWIGVHLMVIAKFPHWWGGWSYGSRLFADALPGFALLTIVLWSNLRAPPLTRRVRWAIRLFLATAILGLWINSYQGIRNPSTLLWNGEPDVDINPAKLFDWDYPQFLASPARNAAQGREYYVPRLEPIPSDQLTTPDSPYLYLENWFPIEHGENDQWRWSRGKTVRIWFKDAPGALTERLTVGVGSVGEQTISVSCDGTSLDTFTHEGFAPQTISWILPSPEGSREEGRIREIAFHIPKAKKVQDAQGSIGLGLHWLRIERAGN